MPRYTYVCDSMCACMHAINSYVCDQPHGLNADTAPLEMDGYFMNDVYVFEAGSCYRTRTSRHPWLYRTNCMHLTNGHRHFCAAMVRIHRHTVLSKDDCEAAGPDGSMWVPVWCAPPCRTSMRNRAQSARGGSGRTATGDGPTSRTWTVQNFYGTLLPPRP